VGKKESEVARPALTAFMEVKAGVVSQPVLSLGPKTEKVTVPVGLSPPAKVAVSEMVPPMTTLAEAWVVIVGLAGLTVTDSAPQPLDAAVFNMSPP